MVSACELLSIEKLATLLCPTVARQLIAWFFNGELVIVCELLSCIDFAHGENDNVLLTIDADHTGETIGLAGVVNETSSIAVHGGINDFIIVNTKHVAANALRVKRGKESVRNT